MTQFTARGKLLLTGEYAVLLGADALAVPTYFGQSLRVETSAGNPYLSWHSIDFEGKQWFSAGFDSHLNLHHTSHREQALHLQKLLSAALQLSGTPLAPATVKTTLDFPNDWGLGSSSTLIHLLAQWFGIDPFELFFRTSIGSAYDIACAGEKKPLVYCLGEKKPFWKTLELPDVYEEAYFIHLNRKQRSAGEVQKFLASGPGNKDTFIQQISNLTARFITVETSGDLIDLIKEHESITGAALGMEPVQKSRFDDYRGAIKSLGAWGGDFIMAIGEDTPAYFQAKGFPTILPFRKMIAQ